MRDAALSPCGIQRVAIRVSGTYSNVLSRRISFRLFGARVNFDSCFERVEVLVEAAWTGIGT